MGEYCILKLSSTSSKYKTFKAVTIFCGFLDTRKKLDWKQKREKTNIHKQCLECVKFQLLTIVLQIQRKYETKFVSVAFKIGIHSLLIKTQSVRAKAINYFWKKFLGR